MTSLALYATPHVNENIVSGTVQLCSRQVLVVEVLVMASPSTEVAMMPAIQPEGVALMQVVGFQQSCAYLILLITDGRS
jgi:hypothetical protein